MTVNQPQMKVNQPPPRKVADSLARANQGAPCSFLCNMHGWSCQHTILALQVGGSCDCYWYSNYPMMENRSSADLISSIWNAESENSRHLRTCYPCSRMVKKCPCCRREIKDRIEAFLWVQCWLRYGLLFLFLKSTCDVVVYGVLIYVLLVCVCTKKLQRSKTQGIWILF